MSEKISLDSSDTELSSLVHPEELLFDTKYKKLPEAEHKKLIP